MKSLIKNFVSHLPAPLVRPVLQRHYKNNVQSITDEEEPDFKIVRKLVSKGDVVVDVGANIGIYTYLLSGLVGGEGKVFSFEPIKETFDYLKFNVDSLGLSNVELNNSAVAKDCGKAKMLVPGEGGDKNIYRASLVEEVDSNSKGSVEDVMTCSLDSKAEDIGKKISFIKIDVEGHELSVIEGSEAVLKQHRPNLLIEIDGNLDSSDSSAVQLSQLLQSYGYSEPMLLDGQSLRPRKSGDSSVNYFFLANEADLNKLQ